MSSLVGLTDRKFKFRGNIIKSEDKWHMVQSLMKLNSDEWLTAMITG